MKTKKFIEVLSILKNKIDKDLITGIDDIINQAKKAAEDYSISNMGLEDICINLVEHFMHIAQSSLGVQCALLCTKKDYLEHMDLRSTIIDSIKNNIDSKNEVKH